MQHFYSSTKFFKRIIAILFCVFCVSFLVFIPQVVFNKNNYSLSLNKYLQKEMSGNVVLSLYHVETFEGGTLSRAKFLERQAIKFNKENPNCFVVVKTLTPDELALNIQNNNIPDMYSFGVGVGEYIAGFLSELEDNTQIRKDLIKYGEINGSLLAFPYILSGYAIISHDSLTQNLDDNNLSQYLSNAKINKKNYKGFSVGINYTNPLSCLNSNNISATASDAQIFQSQYDAYVNFINKKSVSLVGTARDVARCKNREENGTLSACKYNFLGEYSDLLQYISVTTNNSELKEKYAKMFANYLVSPSSQQELSNYGLFAVNKNHIYSGGFMSDFENALSNNLSSINVFTPLSEINNQIENSKREVFKIL